MTDLMKRIAAAGRDLVEVADGVAVSNIDFAIARHARQPRIEFEKDENGKLQREFFVISADDGSWSLRIYADPDLEPGQLRIERANDRALKLPYEESDR